MARPTKREALSALEERLGAPVPEGVGRALTPARLTRLDALIGEAEQRQSDAISAGSDEALRHIPRLLRGPISRALRG